MTTTPTHLDELATSLLHELININNQLEPLKARKEEIEKYLRNMGNGKYTGGVFDLTVSPSKRFNKRKFAEAFPHEAHPHFYKQAAPEPDPKLLAPALKEQFSDVYDSRLTIK